MDINFFIITLTSVVENFPKFPPLPLVRNVRGVMATSIVLQTYGIYKY